MKTKIFFDTEFTGLHQNTTLISIGLISECGKMFYAEFTDFDKSQVDDWIQENVVDALILPKYFSVMQQQGIVCHLGNAEYVREQIEIFLSQFDEIEMWSDCLAYDWMLFCQLWGHAFGIPKNIYYIPFDLCTLFYCHSVDPDISREEFASMVKSENGEPLFFSKDGFMLPAYKHNSLWDAQMIRACFNKLTTINYQPNNHTL